MKRKILSLILVFAMTVSLFTVGTGAVEPTYGDTAGHWAESSIERWSAYGIIQGSNGQFDPNGQLTCAQLATILAKLLKLPAAKDAGFTDNTADAWYYDAINRCAAAGILNGNGDGTVTPEAPITRERAMVMLARALGIEPIRKPDLAKYTDAAQVSAYAQGYLAAMIKAGIVGGVGDNRLAPQDNITRASTVTILDRAIGVYADKDGMTVNAKDGELVLVVAKNVKVINAPEGTEIIVVDGATGLTVNGKSVSDDQTYIVPKTTTSSGSSSSGGHSHSYTSTVTKEPTCTEKGEKTFTCTRDDSTYTEEIPALGHALGNWTRDGQHLAHTRTCSRSNCSYSETENCKYTVTTTNDKDTYTCPVCGDTYKVGKNSAVRIGETGYANLADALAAAGANDTIVLLKDLDVTAQINVTKRVTIEGAGHTIKADNASWLAGNSDKHLLNIQDTSNVTVQNLTLDSNNQACGNQAFNATDVTFTNVTMKKSPNAGLLVNRSTVTANNLTTSDNTWGGVNVDPKAENGTLHFTLTGSSSLGEPTQIWAEKVNGPTVVTADGYYCHLTSDDKNREFYAWSTSVSDTAVAKVKVGGVDVYYTSLEKALSENASEVEITLVKNATLNSGATGVQQGQTRNIKITGAKDITLSLKNTAPGSEGSLNYQDGANLTFSGITVNASEIKGICARGAAVTFENCVFNTELKQTIANKFVFTGCTFTQPVSQVGYGCKEVLFDNCKFNTNGYGIKIYSESSTPVNLTVKNSAFKNPDNAAKSAIFLDHIIDGISYSINVEKCTFEGFTSEPTPNENSYAARVIVSDSFVKSGDQYVFSYQTGAESGSYHKILTADKLTVIIDGVIQLPQGTKPETINKVITESKDAEGNVVKDVKLALPSDLTFELNNGLAHEGDKSRNVTFVGDGTQTMDVITKAISAEGGMLNYQRGSTFTFENLTIQAGEGNFDGIVCNELTYKDCTIKGKLTLFGKATFINCVFDNTMANQYSIWTWGGTDVTFEGCTFNTNGKAILLYGGADGKNPTNLVVNNCTFNDRNNGAAGKAAIEIGNDYNATYSLTVTNATVNGFANGKNTNSKLWANKNSMDAAHLSVTIDGTQVLL